ncbi:MAG: hypothetical protein J6X44_02915 [Thermoguttaceae bacterium]|nr:hypothetical protein [Thermoguttaceae bacterium]
MKHILLAMIALACSIWNASSFAVDVKNKKEMQRTFETFALNKQDFNKPVEDYQERIRADWHYEYVGKSGVSYGEFSIENYTRYEQEFYLNDKTKINIVYYFLKSPEDAMKTTNDLVSTIAVRACALTADCKDNLGTDSADSSYYHINNDYYALWVQCRNISLKLRVESGTLTPEEIKEECHKYVKTVVRRIKNITSHKTEGTNENTPETTESKSSYLHKTNNTSKIQKTFKAFILERKDIQTVEDFKENTLNLDDMSSESIDKLTASKHIEYNKYDQIIILNDGTTIKIIYLLLKTQEDAMKTTNYLVSHSEYNAYPLYLKKYLGLESYETADFCKEEEGFTLRFQCKKICITFKVHSDEQDKTVWQRGSEYEKLAKIIVTRIKNMDNRKMLLQ